MTTIPHFINGQPYTPDTSTGGGGLVNKASFAKQQEVYNPKTGQPLAKVLLGSETDAKLAVDVANEAFQTWSKVPIEKRALILMNFLKLIGQQHESIATALTQEHGKSLANARAEIIHGVDILKFAIQSPALLKSTLQNNEKNDTSNVLMRESLGVITGITMSNFPVMSAMCMFPVALVCGNTFILKPSPENPSSSLAIAQLLKQAGLPDGVFNVMQGDKIVSETLIRHPDVAGLSYTGLAKNANQVYEEGAHYGKRVQTLGRAKTHMIIMPDADIEHTCETLMQTAFINVGEGGMAISTVMFVGGIGKIILPMLRQRVINLQMNDGRSPEGDMAPISSPHGLETIKLNIEMGFLDGAKLLVDGREFKHSENPHGFWIGPTLFDEVRPEMKIYKEEFFGPILPCMHIDTMEEAIKLTNAHELSNGVCCFTNDARTAHQFAHLIEVGMIGINSTIPEPMAWRGFGGWKRGLFGDMHAYGEESLRFYTRQKSVLQQNLANVNNGMSFFAPNKG